MISSDIMTKPIWNWSVSPPFSHFMTGVLRYLIYIIPASIGVAYDLTFRDIHAAYLRISSFYAKCWPQWFDEPDG